MPKVISEEEKKAEKTIKKCDKNIKLLKKEYPEDLLYIRSFHAKKIRSLLHEMYDKLAEVKDPVKWLNIFNQICSNNLPKMVEQDIEMSYVPPTINIPIVDLSKEKNKGENNADN